MQCAADSFRINTSTDAAFGKAQIGSQCPEDYIGIEGKQIATKVCDSSRDE